MAPAARRVVAVAASGGRDSTALLHATVRAAAACGVQVVALHVHHGLNPGADDWARHVRRQCARWQAAGWPVRCEVAHLSGGPAPGQSVEAWARTERYAALTRLAKERGASLVLLAHHRRDQAETVLLQALRGAGISGLAAMPAQADRQGLRWCRPWLGQDDAAIAAYVRRHRLSHIDDDSNQDPRYDRNRLRLQVWPALLQAFPHAASSLVQSAAQAARAAELTAEISKADLSAVQDAEAGLRLEPWLALSPARRWFALRAWLDSQLPHGAPGPLLERVFAEAPGRRVAQWPAGAGAVVRLYRGVLVCEPAVAAMPEAAGAVRASCLALDRVGTHVLPEWGGRLRVTRVRRGGLPAARLAQAELRGRQGGESFLGHERGVPRSLKKQFQAAGIPAWQRQGPLVYAGGQLLWVPGLGADARALARGSEPQLRLQWLPDPA